MILEKIKKPNDIKKVNPADYDLLADEIRMKLIETVSKNGGHLASNLGAVELTMALHLTMNLPQDKLIWDVGHQSYTHKLLTGRQAQFDTLRKYEGMSGFPKRNESPCDAFDTGHSSTSISAGLGYVKARDIRHEEYKVVSVIGDGSLTGGLAYEALNNASKLNSNFIIVLNDNNMSISENVGGVSKYLNNIRTADSYQDLKKSIYDKLNRNRMGTKMVETIRRTKSSLKQLVIPGMFFEDMGITYLGPVDGHDVQALTEVFKEAQKLPFAVLVHVITEKGHGYQPAVRHPSKFHGTDPFDIETGLPVHVREKSSYTDVFATIMCKLGKRNEDVVAITAAMSDGTGLKRYRNMYPDRFVDVGIAEGHAVTFAAGLAAGGLRPIVSIYSSFLQRAFDEIIHDVCIQNLPVVFAIDRAGLVGSDGETHQGIFDLSYMSMMPNMTVMAPKNKWELSDMMKFAVRQDGPVSVRYPRGEAYDGLQELRDPIVMGRSELLAEGNEVVIFALGTMVITAMEVRERLREQGLSVTVYNARFVKPLPEEQLLNEAMQNRLLVTMEENVITGGFGEQVTELIENRLPDSDVRILNIAIPDMFVSHGPVPKLKENLRIDSASVTQRILEALREEA